MNTKIAKHKINYSYTNQNTICQFSSEADENAEKTQSFLTQLQRR